MIDQDAGDSESDRRKKKKRSKAEKKDKALKDKVHGSVSTNPVPVLEKALVPSVVPEAVGGPMSFTAVTVAVCKEEEEEEEEGAEEAEEDEKRRRLTYRRSSGCPSAGGRSARPACSERGEACSVNTQSKRVYLLLYVYATAVNATAVNATQFSKLNFSYIS